MENLMSYPGQSELYQDYNAISINYTKSWSASDVYYCVPQAATWAGGTLTVTSKNHNLATADVVNFVSNVGASSWNMEDLEITVVDKDTFTVEIAEPADDFPDRVLTTSTEKVIVTCADYSKMMFKPMLLQVEALPTGVTIVVQSKVHPAASWKDMATVVEADGVTQVVFSPLVNIVRCVKTAGAGQPVVYAQYTVY